MTSPTTGTASSSAAAGASRSGAPDVDAVDAPTHHLYHMSRTAGVGLGDYAAINVRAVIGLMLGVASVLAYIFADSLLPLAIPLAAFVVSGVALVQIRASNGTQTGRGLAIGGVGLALLLGGMTIAKQAHNASAQATAKLQLDGLVKQFSDANNAHDAKAAYALFTKSFQSQVVFDSFERTLISRAEKLFGDEPVDHCELGPRVNFDAGPTGGLTTATTLIVMYGKPPAPGQEAQHVSIPIDFTLEEGRWKIQDVRDYFIQAPRGR